MTTYLSVMSSFLGKISAKIALLQFYRSNVQGITAISQGRNPHNAVLPEIGRHPREPFRDPRPDSKLRSPVFSRRNQEETPGDGSGGRWLWH